MAEQKFTIDGANVTIIAAPLSKIYIDAIKYLLSNHKQNFRWITVDIPNKKPSVRDGYKLTYGTFNQHTDTLRDIKYAKIISVAGNKDEKRPLKDIMHTYFHEYGHLLQYSNGVVKSMSHKEAEDDADKFADTYLPVFLKEYGHAV